MWGITIVPLCIAICGVIYMSFSYSENIHNEMNELNNLAQGVLSPAAQEATLLGPDSFIEQATNLINASRVDAVILKANDIEEIQLPSNEQIKEISLAEMQEIHIYSNINISLDGLETNGEKTQIATLYIHIDHTALYSEISKIAFFAGAIIVVLLMCFLLTALVLIPQATRFLESQRTSLRALANGEFVTINEEGINIAELSEIVENINLAIKNSESDLIARTKLHEKAIEDHEDRRRIAESLSSSIIHQLSYCRESLIPALISKNNPAVMQELLQIAGIIDGISGRADALSRSLFFSLGSLHTEPSNIDSVFSLLINRFKQKQSDPTDKNIVYIGGIDAEAEIYTDISRVDWIIKRFYELLGEIAPRTIDDSYLSLEAIPSSSGEVILSGELKIPSTIDDELLSEIEAYNHTNSRNWSILSPEQSESLRGQLQLLNCKISAIRMSDMYTKLSIEFKLDDTKPSLNKLSKIYIISENPNGFIDDMAILQAAGQSLDFITKDELSSNKIHDNDILMIDVDTADESTVGVVRELKKEVTFYQVACFNPQYNPEDFSDSLIDSGFDACRSLPMPGNEYLDMVYSNPKIVFNKLMTSIKSLSSMK